MGFAVQCIQAKSLDIGCGEALKRKQLGFAAAAHGPQKLTSRGAGVLHTLKYRENDVRHNVIRTTVEQTPVGTATVKVSLRSLSLV